MTITADDPLVTEPKARVEAARAHAALHRALAFAVTVGTIVGTAAAIDALIRW